MLVGVQKILVIDDHEPMRRNVAVILEMEGFKPLSAANGPAGLDLARKEKPDLILCDVTMPGMDGHAVLRAIREDKELSGIPFVFLSAHDERLEAREGDKAEADGYLTKPISHDELLSTITTRLEREGSGSK
jgi:CheY-like chemotaxis protein